MIQNMIAKNKLNEMELIKEIQAGKNKKKNMEIFWNQYQGLVYKMAQVFKKKCQFPASEAVEDFCQEAYFLLEKVVYNCNTEKMRDGLKIVLFFKQRLMKLTITMSRKYNCHSSYCVTSTYVTRNVLQKRDLKRYTSKVTSISKDNENFYTTGLDLLQTNKFSSESGDRSYDFLTSERVSEIYEDFVHRIPNILLGKDVLVKKLKLKAPGKAEHYHKYLAIQRIFDKAGYQDNGSNWTPIIREEKKNISHQTFYTYRNNILKKCFKYLLENDETLNLQKLRLNLR